MNDEAEFRHFKYLLAIAEHRGFRAAAEALHTSQPSLSRQVKEFQERFKIKLFRRLKGGRIQLTPAGEALRVIARDVLETRDQALEALEAIHRGEAEILRIGCTPFVDKEICRRSAEIQKSLVPASTVRYSTGETAPLMNELADDQLDVVIVSLPVSDDALRVEIVKRERLVVCLPADHSLAKKTALNATDLSQNLTVFRHPSQHPEAHERLRELLAELGVEFEEHSHTSHPHEMQEVVKTGDGFALLREGTPLIEGLVTRPILGVDWTVDTAMVFKRETRLKILPVIARNLRKQFWPDAAKEIAKKPPKKVRIESPSQMRLLG